MTGAHHPERVLVTGGGGFLGSAVVRALAARGDRLRTYSRRRYAHLDALDVEQIQGDLTDADRLVRAARGCDLVVHTAAKAGIWGNPTDFFRTNLDGTRIVLDACRKAQVPRLVHTSSPSVVFDGSDMEGVDESLPFAGTFHAPYPASKAAAEKAVRDAARTGLLTICLRPHLIWGPGDNHLVPRILSRGRRLRQVGDGHNRVDTVYVDNAADAHLLAADRLVENPSLSGRVYFISNGEPLPLWEMVNRILAAGGLPPVRNRISVHAARRIGIALECVYRLFRLPGEPPMTRFLAEELATSHWFDISAAVRDLGYRPRVTIDEGFERLAQWLQREGTERKASR